VLSFEEFKSLEGVFDMITCFNVLSAIPCEQTIDITLAKFKRLIRDDGRLVVVNQHRNSYFKTFKEGAEHLYGHISSKGSYHTYYGIMDRETVSRLLRQKGFEVINSWNEGERNFVIGN
jgi:2-polyprenyl-3-methyl-5-hydroxy-6-metoxy-1,4-benzoquinol methylase